MKRRLPALVVLVCAALAPACGDINDSPEKKCPAKGVLDCPCLSNNTCNRQADGTVLVCEEGTCHLPDCPADNALAKGCLCGGTRLCAEGLLCTNGNCAEDTGQSISPPADPLCYTPCQGGSATSTNGQSLSCNDEGLIEGCVGDAVCVDGTCVLPQSPPATSCTSDSECPGGVCLASSCVRACRSTAECALEEHCEAGLCAPGEATAEEAAGACAADDDCPSYQSCIANRCYSDCEQDSDCRGGRVCKQKSCRVPCDNSQSEGSSASLGTGSCPSGTYCQTSDGYTGVCMPFGSSSSGTESPRQPDAATNPGYFELSERTLQAGPRTEELAIRIVSRFSEARTFTLRKAAHVEIKDGVPTEVTDTPMHWVEMGESEVGRVQELQITIPGMQTGTVLLRNFTNSLLKRWMGTFEVTTENQNAQTVRVNYVGSPEGQWAGRVFYLANFGTVGLNEWMADRDNAAKLQVVGNALVRRWAAVRGKRLSVREFRQVLNATLNGSWRYPSVQARCPTEANPNPNVGCYLYDNEDGISIYSEYLPDNPIPTGTTEFPVVMNLRASDPGRPGVWSGRILSSESLQYAGDPTVSLSFTGDPQSCDTPAGEPCVTFVDKMSFELLVGGRYRTTATDVQCARAASGTFQLRSTPWLVPGFLNGTTADAQGRRYRYECRDTLLPFSDPTRKSLNSSLAAANPIPDGSTRRRQIEILDGALMDLETLFILFRERFPSFLDSEDQEGFTAYGVMELHHSPKPLQDEDYAGSQIEDSRVGDAISPPACTENVLQKIGGPITSGNASAAAVALVTGVLPSASGPGAITAEDDEVVHYYCEDTNLFDGGPGDDGSALAVREACPAGSRVIYFTLKGPLAEQSAIAGLECQKRAACTGSQCDCFAVLQEWMETGGHNIRVGPAWECSTLGAVFCDADRYNPRNGKTFFKAAASALWQPLDAEIQDAFRYKTKFKNRSGTNVGFAPSACLANSNQVPYCYDAASIEEIAERVDCAVHVYTTFYDDLGIVESRNARSLLRDFLVRSFAYEEEIDPLLPMPIEHDGFERLFSELAIMLGDESYTRAFLSRFDLAGMNLGTFEGDKFEPNGIMLSGGAGYEMVTLYQAAQYYQMALDRFYSLSATFWKSLQELPPGQGFITPQTVTSYFARLIRASSQKSRAWSEIAKRYQSFNRPDLARLVVERAYTAAHLESIVLARMMLKVLDAPDSTAAAQIVKEVETAQATYTAALMEMRNVYDDITDNVTYFGFQPDYIPFPVLYPTDNNAFEKMLDRAREKLAAAKEKEVLALADNRAFETNSAAFQSELAGITRQYETQLADICGTFQVTAATGEVAVFPAISKYAYLDPEGAARLGDPCGLMGNGQLADAMTNLRLATLELDDLKLSERNLLMDMADAEARTNAQCQRMDAFATLRLEAEDQKIGMRQAILGLQTAMRVTERAIENVRTIAQFSKCSVGTSSDCPTAAVASALYGTVACIAELALDAAEITVAELEHQLLLIDRAVLAADLMQECAAIQIDLQFTLRTLARKAIELQLDVVKLQQRLRLALSAIQKLRNEAIMLSEQENEATELAINVEAARSDPNVRIYRNDTVLAADRTFYAALQDAYRLTKIYEYYTSQSYGPMVQLQLIRMVAHGDYTLENYVAELTQAFYDFQEQYGASDLRVAIISLRDDIFGTPQLTNTSTGADATSRREQFVARLMDVSWLDDRGYIVIPFSTSLDSVSPLTRNHKIQYVEVEVNGTDVGDTLGRAYLRQRGTAVVRSLDDQLNYYALPDRTAVVDVYYNGFPFFDREVYRSNILRDRPLVNTGWELVINTKDESVNKDINLASLTDIRLHIYYTDFVAL
jgi:hypothetical protein